MPTNKTNKISKNDPDDIDYMHPDGKPLVQDKESERSSDHFDGEELQESVARKQYQLQEADGHHMCSQACRRRHSSNPKP